MEDNIILDDYEQESQLTLSYIKKVIRVEQEIKGLKEDIKTLWTQSKDEGVDVPIAKKSLSQLKREFKLDKGIKSDLEDTIKYLKEDVELNSLLTTLVQK